MNIGFHFVKSGGQSQCLCAFAPCAGAWHDAGVRGLAIACWGVAAASCVSPTSYEWDLGSAHTLIFNAEGSDTYEVVRAPSGPTALLFRPLESPTQFHVFAETLAELGLAEGPLAAPIAGQPRRRLPPPAQVLDCREGTGSCAVTSAFRPLPEIPEGCFDVAARTTVSLPVMQRAVLARPLDAEHMLVGTRTTEDAERFYTVSRAGVVEPFGVALGSGFFLRTGFSAGPLLWVFDNTRVALLRVEDGRVTVVRAPEATGCAQFSGDLAIDGDPESTAQTPTIYLQDESHAVYRYDGSTCHPISPARPGLPLRKGSVAFDPGGVYFASSDARLRYYSTRSGTTTAALEVSAENVVSVVRRLPSGLVLAAVTTNNEFLPRPLRLYARASGESRFMPWPTGAAPPLRWLETIETFRGGLVLGGNPAAVSYLVGQDYCPPAEPGTGNIQMIVEVDRATIFASGPAPTSSSNAVVAFLKLRLP